MLIYAFPHPGNPAEHPNPAHRPADPTGTTGREVGSEGDNIQAFVEEFIKSELSLPETRLRIQCCHQSLASRPPPGSSPDV